MSGLPRRVLLGKYGGELSDIDQLALRAWPAVLARGDVGLLEAADAAYRAAESMLVAMHHCDGPLTIKRSGGDE